jgi:uroporphyrinogen-III decarboxylase
VTKTHKERILAAAERQPVDKLPFGARIDLWYNYHFANGTLPGKYRGCTEIEILRELGAGGTVVLGSEQVRSSISQQAMLITLWETTLPNVEVVVKEEGPIKTVTYETPNGCVSTKTEFNKTEGYLQGYIVERLFKSEEDYPAIEYILEDSLLTPEYSEYIRLADEIADDGVIRCGLRTSPMQYIMRDLMGYETFFYEMTDHPDRMNHLYEVAKGLWKKQMAILINSPARLLSICSNWSDEIHTPVFKKYFIPWLQEATEFLHSGGKLTLIHCDGEIRRLIPLILESGIDVAEAWSPAPMTSVTKKKKKKAWGDKITIWGGLPTLIFEPTYSDEKFESYVINLFKEVAPGNNYILGMGDNFPIDGDINRLQRIVELIDQYGVLPIRI